MDVGTSNILVPIPHVYHIQGNAAVIASNSFPVLFAHAEVIEGGNSKAEGIEQQGGGPHVPINYKAGKAGDEHKQKKKWRNFNSIRGLSHCATVAEAIDIVAATRADRIWIAWSGSSHSVRATEISGQTAPTSPSGSDLERQQWYTEEIPDEIQPVPVLEDGLGQQQQECNDEEISDIILPASPSEVGDLGEQEVSTVE